MGAFKLFKTFYSSRTNQKPQREARTNQKPQREASQRTESRQLVHPVGAFKLS